MLTVGELRFPRYRLFILALAALIGAALWLALDRTRVGAMIRAAVDDAEMAQGVGIRVPTVSMGVFALGAFLAALGGVIGGGFLGVYPGLDFEILPYAFVVVIVGGLGSLPGAMVGSVLVGPARQLRQGAVPRAGLLHALRADGADPGAAADRAVRPHVIPRRVLAGLGAAVLAGLVAPTLSAYP